MIVAFSGIMVLRYRFERLRNLSWARRVSVIELACGTS